MYRINEFPGEGVEGVDGGLLEHLGVVSAAFKDEIAAGPLAKGEEFIVTRLFEVSGKKLVDDATNDRLCLSGAWDSVEGGGFDGGLNKGELFGVVGDIGKVVLDRF
jgi:hypothetical protein